MRKGVTVEVSSADRVRLAVIAADRNSAQKYVWRARIVLMTADGVGTNAIMRQTGKSKVTVWRWQERFMAQGIDGLLRDKTRPARIAALPVAVRERAVALTLSNPPGETTHWTAGLAAQQLGISLSSVQRIWRAHGRDYQEFRAEVGHDRSKGARRCHDAKSLAYRTPSLTSCWLALIRRRFSIRTGCSTI